jgi:signal transduction histidine kinase
MAIDASAYRIIQESLTNALKYAGHAPTSVTVRFDSDGLGLEVVNDAGDESGGAHAAGTGHGIVGMRERAAMHKRKPRSRAATEWRLQRARTPSRSDRQ